MRAHDRKPVIAWLKRYDKAALAIPEPLRAALRAEIDEHLEDTLLADASDEDVRVVLEELGDPKQLVAAEVAAAAEVHVDPRPRLRRRTLATAAIVIIVVALFLAIGLPLAQVLGR
jgi:HAAS domain-containing protein